MTPSGVAWEDYLRSKFPGYLLPESQREQIDVESAARFVERLTGRAQLVEILRAVSMIATHMDDLREFALRELPLLVRSLTARASVQTRVWEGGYQGRLDVRATLERRLGGEPTCFVTRTRQRRFDLPEQVLVRAIACRLLALLTKLRAAGVLASYGWSAEALVCEGSLRHVLEASVLREIPDARPEAFHVRAAAIARHPCYALACHWYQYLAEGLDDDDPARIARVVADGALTPLEPEHRFELAVAIRLLQTLATAVDRAEPGRWTVFHTLVIKGRREFAVLARDDGTRIELFYNQAELPPGPRDNGVRHYFLRSGRLRPDVTVCIRLPGSRTRAMVLEAKLSSDPGYLIRGYHEALLYTMRPCSIGRSMHPTLAVGRRRSWSHRERSQEPFESETMWSRWIGPHGCPSRSLTDCLLGCGDLIDWRLERVTTPRIGPCVAQDLLTCFLKGKRSQWCTPLRSRFTRRWPNTWNSNAMLRTSTSTTTA